MRSAVLSAPQQGRPSAFSCRLQRHCQRTRVAATLQPAPPCRQQQERQQGQEQGQEQVPRRQALALLSGLVASSFLMAAPLPSHARTELPNKEVDDATSPFVQKLLQRSVENKERYTKERLQAYNRRNFKEYFEFEASDPRVAKARGISPEMQQAIAKWLEDNK